MNQHESKKSIGREDWNRMQTTNLKKLEANFSFSEEK